MSLVESVLAIIYFVGVLGSLVFVIRRAATRWWKWAEGAALLLQHLMLVGFGASAVLGLRFGQDYPGRMAVTMVLMFGFTFAVWWLTVLQERARLEARRNPPAQEPLSASQPSQHQGRRQADPL
jgi:hypothetical protein